jgi:broad specificity phosphatase PhoE
LKLDLLRHGLTDWNLEKRVQGRIDRPLSPEGRAQLARLDLPPESRERRWYCSPLRRAGETAQAFGLAGYRLEPALVEMSWGEWEGEILKPLRRRLGAEMRGNEARGIDFCPPGGESPRQVQARLEPWLETIAASGEDTAAVVHKGIIRCIYSLASGWDMCGESPVDFAWDALHRFELDTHGRLLDSYTSVPLIKK